MSPAIVISQLHFKYDEHVILSDINLDIDKSEYIAILGPNGGGKSTLIKLITGTLKPTAGTIKFDRQLRLGYIPQRIATNLHFPATVSEIISSGGTLDTTITDKLNISHLLPKTIAELSGGERQKVFIARSLVGKPHFLILDEPTVGIDQKSQDEFWSLLKNLHTDGHIGIILISHDIAEVTKDATRILYLNRALEYNQQTHIHIQKEHIEKILHSH